MLMNAILSRDVSTWIVFLLSIPIILFSLSFHEASHAFIAHKLGDDTARNMGRMTLNPFSHIHPFGFLSMLLIGIGWAKPVPITAGNFKNPRKGMMLSSLAGPVSNLILGIGFVILSSATLIPYNLSAVADSEPDMFWVILYEFFFVGGYLNFSLFLFNLIPIPPFDGSRIFFYFLPKDWYFKVMKYERYIGLGLLILILFLEYFFDFSPVAFLAQGLFNLVSSPFNKLAAAIFQAIQG